MFFKERVLKMFILEEKIQYIFKKIIIVLCCIVMSFFISAQPVSADFIKLKNGKIIYGDIITRTDKNVVMNTGKGEPEFYFTFEIKKIQQDGIFERNIKTIDGVIYDLTLLSEDFDPANLVLAVDNINGMLNASIDGVKILHSEVDISNAYIVKTPLIINKEGEMEDPKLVLMIFIVEETDVAYDPTEFIVTSILNKRSFLYQQNLQRKEAKKENSFFGIKNILQEKKKDSTWKDKIVLKSISALEKVGQKLEIKMGVEKAEEVTIREVNFAFSEMFAKKVYAEDDENKNFEIKLADYSSILKRDPKNINALLSRAKEYYWQNQFKAAKKDLFKVIQIKDDEAQAYLFLGYISEKEGNIDTAFDRYTLVIKYAEDISEAYFSRGLIYNSKLKYDLAVEDFNKALKISPSFARGYVSRGFAYFNLGKNYMAKLDFLKAIKLNPDLAQAYNNLGYISEKNSNLNKAAEYYSAAINRYGYYAEAYNNRGFINEQLNKIDLAIEDYSKALKINPQYVDAYNNRGFAYNVKGQYQLAVSDFSMVIKINAQYAEAYHNRAIMYYHLKKYESSYEDIIKAQSLGYVIDENLLKDVQKKL